MNLENNKKTNKVCNTKTEEHYFEDSTYRVKINYAHYVVEYWHPNLENLEDNGKLQNGHMIKSRDNYQVPDYAYAFQFFDLLKIGINTEGMYGTQRHNLSPVIYVGKRYFIGDKLDFLDDDSLIIDKDGGIHAGKSGIVYDEYLELLKIKKSNNVKSRVLKKDMEEGK